MPSINSAASILFSYAKTVPKSTFLYFFDFVVGMTALLVFFQYSILYLIPVEFTLDYIYLNVTTPNVSSMLLSNYMHNPLDPSHIANNLPTTVFLILATFLVGIIILPATGCRMPSKFFPMVYLVFFLLLPFPISGISIWAARIMGKSWCSGFSGINFALLGLLFFLMLTWLYITTLQSQNNDAYRSTFALLSGTFLLLMIVMTAVFLDLKDSGINLYGHLGGFMLGLLMPALIGLGIVAEKVQQKVVIGLIIGFVIGVLTIVGVII